VSFDRLQPGLAAFVESHAAELVTQVTATTKDAIRAALGEALVEGEGIPSITKRLREASAFSRDRAALIARTEVTRVTNGGQRATLEAWSKETGDMVRKRWLTANDARVRAAHRVMEGETRAIDEAFSNGLQHPGEPNCRCTLVYELQEAA
jgi:SPP1 gp7 family putative phage head morphogenesis protein